MERADREFREKAAVMGVLLLALTSLLLWAAIQMGLRPEAMMRRLENVPGATGGERLDKARFPPNCNPSPER